VREPVERPLILCEKASPAHAAVGGDPWRPQLQAEAIQPFIDRDRERVSFR